ncbi:MAG: hypothetical protein F4056_04950 [Chloroflexi bacterium]|nr:hypothetical protein [Chloroflexota bacterium]
MLRQIAVAIPIVGGLVAGALIGGVLMKPEPAIVGWLFGAGAGLMGGAFIVAIATNEALAGRGSADPRSVSYPGASPPRRRDEDEDEA